jgi:integrase/recombinase XerD
MSLRRASQARPTKVKPPIGDVRDPNSLYHYMQRYLSWQNERNYSDATVSHAEHCLRGFILWCDERGLQRPQDITKPILERYQRHLFLYRQDNGQPLSPRTQVSRLSHVRGIFKWLAKQNHILYNPASDLDMPRIDYRLPKHILTVAEVETVMAQVDLGNPMGIRDRAILETFYSTGIRRREMMHLNVFDVDPIRGTLMIRQGKGQRDRMIPIGVRALAWVSKYCDDIRPQLVAGADSGRLFLTLEGETFSTVRMSDLVRIYVRKAKLGKEGSCHLFRHTMATLMLENGADIRYIQTMLGHANLNTTQLYTQVSIRQLKDIHTATHPGRVIGSAEPVHAAPTDSAALLAALEAEAAEEDDD